MYRFRREVILLVVFILSIVDQARTLVPFKKDSFSLRATITQLDVKSTFKEPKSYLFGYSYEQYSISQRRAVLSYALLRRQFKAGELFHDAKEKQTLVFEHPDKTCRLADGLNELKLLPNLDVSSLKLDDSGDSDHVIGLARLLLFVEHHKDKLKMVGEPLEKRNMLALEYSYNFDDVQLNIYYNGMALTQDPDALPMQIIVSAQQQIYVVDFSRLVGLSVMEQEVNNPDGIFIDRFAFPQECASPLRYRSAQKLLGSDKFGEFSFQARTSPRSSMSKISYYHNMDSLSIIYGTKKRKRGNSNLKKAFSVVNFKFKRAYQVVERGVDDQTTRDCYVFKTASLSGQRQTISETLTGANSFIYLGLAEVRGATVRLFAAVESTIPLWMEQPLEYTSRGAQRARDPLFGMDSSKEPMTTLIYVANDDRVVMLELIKHKYKAVIELYNFKWSLDPADSASELFSLHSACANTIGIRHSQVEMLLGKSDGHQFALVSERNKLDLSLMSAIQEELSIPASMVYDLEPKIIGHKDLFVSFRVASHMSSVESLLYLGKGSMAEDQKAKLVAIVDSFQTCFQLATRQEAKKFQFGYDNRNMKCALISSIEDVELKSGDQADDGQLMEIYETEHDETKVITIDKDISDGRWLEGSDREAYRRSLVGKRLALNIPGPLEPFSWFQIKRLQVERRGAQEVGLPDVIQGFGLVEENENRRLEGSKSQMSLVECRSACLASDTCESYSLCRRPQGLECILSPANFQSAWVRKQLSPAKSDKFLAVNLDNGKQVKLVKRLTCDLYNKLYVNLFDQDGKSLQSLNPKQRLVAVTRGQEDCAKVCVQVSLQVLAQEASISTELNQLLSSKMSAEQKGQLEHLLRQRKENSEKLCTGFLYLEASLVDDSEGLAAKFKMGPDELKSYPGFCALEVNQVVGDELIKGPQANIGDLRFTYLRYKFNLVHFYTAQRGVHMLASELTDEQKSAYKLVKRHSSELTEAHYNLLRDSLDLGNNLQEVFVLDERNCANLCFFGEFGRSQGPWPMCKSFDISYNDGLKRKVCHLNSMSLGEAVRNEWTSLMDDKSGDQWVEWWHFEPGFLLAQNLESLSEARLEVEQSNWFKFKQQPLVVGGLLLFLLSWLAVLGGLFLGLRGGQRLLQLSRVERELERESIAKLDFANQVDEHGTVAE